MLRSGLDDPEAGDGLLKPSGKASSKEHGGSRFSELSICDEFDFAENGAVNNLDNNAPKIKRSKRTKKSEGGSKGSKGASSTANGKKKTKGKRLALNSVFGLSK